MAPLLSRLDFIRRAAQLLQPCNKKVRLHETENLVEAFGTYEMAPSCRQMSAAGGKADKGR